MFSLSSVNLPGQVGDRFETLYLNMFKQENELLGDEIYAPLNKLFCDADAYCSNASLRNKNDINGDELLLSAKECLSDLQKIL